MYNSQGFTFGGYVKQTFGKDTQITRGLIVINLKKIA